jgi:hypothetical protein
MVEASAKELQAMAKHMAMKAMEVAGCVCPYIDTSVYNDSDSEDETAIAPTTTHTVKGFRGFRVREKLFVNPTEDDYLLL